MSRRLFGAWLLGLAVLLSGCAARLGRMPAPEIVNPVRDVRGRAGDALEVGFAKRVVTPNYPTVLGGFGLFRFAYGVHDDIYVRTLVVRQGEVKLALVAVDVVGIQRGDVMAMKAGVSGWAPEAIMIASTHTHGAPDTLGLWGLPPLISGASKRLKRAIGQAVAATIAEAEAAAVPARAFTAVYPADPQIMYNANEGEPEDHHLGLMVFKDRSGGTIATLVNAVGHPEAMWSDNHSITADYPGRVCALCEDEYGGGAIFFSGALGAMMTPTPPEPPAKRDFENLERVAQAVFGDVRRGMGLLAPEHDPILAHRLARFDFPVQNDLFKTLVRTGIIDREVYAGERIVTEAAVIEIGSAQFVTFPGEAYPKLGLSLRAHQKPNSFQIGLADDELGYILYPDDYGTELYDYETSMCAGPQLSVRLEETLLGLLAGR